jgi:hypothetical protein
MAMCAYFRVTNLKEQEQAFALWLSELVKFKNCKIVINWFFNLVYVSAVFSEQWSAFVSPFFVLSLRLQEVPRERWNACNRFHFFVGGVTIAFFG